MLDDTTLDELYVNLDSHPTLTRDPIDQVHSGNTVKVSNYIWDLQQPGGVGGRVWTPFGKETPLTKANSLLELVLEITQGIVKILCIALFISLCFLYFK
jgi:hypothetical protein